MPPDAYRWHCRTHGDGIRVHTDDHGIVLCAVDGCLEMAWYYTGPGSAISTMAPDVCAGPDRHPLTPPNVGVSWLSCGDHGHRTWLCHTCLAVIYGPPRRDGCREPGVRRKPAPEPPARTPPPAPE